MKKLMLYLEIQQMKERDFSIQQIARQLKISRTTVYTYLEMTTEEAFEWVNSLGSRKKKVDPYKDEYCEQIEPPVRMLEPASAINRATQCDRESH